MGARGPAPMSADVLDMRGSWRAKGRRQHEPQPQRGTPEVPTHLGEPQRQVWHSLCRILEDMGLMTKADASQLERYCVYYVRWRAGEAFLARQDAKHGDTVPPGCYPMFSDDADTYAVPINGGKALIGYVEYPAVRESHRLDQALKQIEIQFGLTPSARARIAIANSDAPDPDAIGQFARKRGA